MSPSAANITHDVLDTAFWGPVTATLDWCEANYQFSRYIAEAANTFSNLITLAYAFYGIYLVQKARLPSRYLIGWTGFALVGLGSFIFHATLLYEAQLADELPMIYVASYCSAVLLDSKPGYDIANLRSSVIFASMLAFNVLFTWAYAVYRNPVFHQIVFASIMFSTVFRTMYVLGNASPYAQRIPAHAKKVVTRLFGTGAATFLLGFFIWNLDNIFCLHLTSWKHRLGWPGAFVLEGHSWWHILTATGTYLMLMGNTYLTLGIKDSFSNFEITTVYGLPAIERAGASRSKTAKSKLQ